MSVRALAAGMLLLGGCGVLQPEVEAPEYAVVIVNDSDASDRATERMPDAPRDLACTGRRG